MQTKQMHFHYLSQQLTELDELHKHEIHQIANLKENILLFKYQYLRITLASTE